MMISPASDSNSKAFAQLDERIQRWIWSEGWTTLRDVQERAIPALIGADRDVILAATTSSGKTEAAFFPILTNLLRRVPERGAVVYVSPLKALINDQWMRLTGLCESLDIPVVGWHGDISASRKHRFLKDRNGIVLITPESLEALFVTRGSTLPSVMENLCYVVVDELHAFIGSERGKQLQSLLHRLECAVGKFVPRIGLSATLGGNKGTAANFLRPHGSCKFELIDSKESQEVKLLVKGYSNDGESHGDENATKLTVAKHLYDALRGSNNLIFPNSRSQVEFYADFLRRLCEQDNVPNEFWAHHGSLSKELREDTERELKSGSRSATAICTTTLELGIDIGQIRSIAQIGPPPSVASLRQRLGRSGRRRGEPATLRCFCIEPKISPKSVFSDRLHEGLVQTIAMVQLVIAGWFEAPRASSMHASTFVQQVLSVIAERGGITLTDLWTLLVKSGPFDQIDRNDFLNILRALSEKDLLFQDRSGILLHGTLGEKLVNQFDFYGAFVSNEEFRILSEGRLLGAIPISRPLTKNQCIIFAGRRWRVRDVDLEKREISVTPNAGGVPPVFDGAGCMVDNHVREAMRNLLATNETIPFLDSLAAELLSEARGYYRSAALDSARLIELGNSVIVPTWRGDCENDTLALLLSSAGLTAWNEGLALHVSESTLEKVREALVTIGSLSKENIAQIKLSRDSATREKWDWALPDEVLIKSFTSHFLDVDGAQALARSLGAK
jgi:ATP-dependent helicase Lhr and Lhr-like helicase